MLQKYIFYKTKKNEVSKQVIQNCKTKKYFIKDIYVTVYTTFKIKM